MFQKNLAVWEEEDQKSTGATAEAEAPAKPAETTADEYADVDPEIRETVRSYNKHLEGMSKVERARVIARAQELERREAERQAAEAKKAEKPAEDPELTPTEKELQLVKAKLERIERAQMSREQRENFESEKGKIQAKIIAADPDLADDKDALADAVRSVIGAHIDGVANVDSAIKAAVDVRKNLTQRKLKQYLDGKSRTDRETRGETGGGVTPAKTEQVPSKDDLKNGTLRDGLAAALRGAR